MRNVKKNKKRGWLAFFDCLYRFLSNHCVFVSFCFKRYLVSDFIANNENCGGGNKKKMRREIKLQRERGK